MATIYFTASGGDELRILDFDTSHPRLQIEYQLVCGDWRDTSPKLYPNALFALSITLIRLAAEDPDTLGLDDAGLRVEED